MRGSRRRVRARRPGGGVSTRSCGRARGGCSPRRWRPKSRPISLPISSSVTRPAGRRLVVKPDRVDLCDRTVANQGHEGPGKPGGRARNGVQAAGAALEHWRYVNGAHLVALVRAGAKFEKGVLVERPEQAAHEVAA